MVRKIALNFKIKEIELNQIIFRNRICHVQIQAKETVNIINVRGVFQKYAESFHRMFAIAARLMISHVKHAWYLFIKCR